MNRTFCFLLLSAGLCLLYACNDGFDDYSKSPDKFLTFSTDTVAFDTIITTINTPYQLFKVYNPHSKPLLISSVYLENGESSGFKINVDGRAGSAFENVEIRGNDSIYVLVDAKPAKNNSNRPEYVTDRVVFVTNGVRQQVLLEASSQDAVIWKGFTIQSNYTVLSNQKPFVIYDSLVVQEGATLLLQEGTTLYMHGNAEIIVRGTLKATGTLKKPVLIRGDRFDKYVNIAYDLVPGQWGGIRFETSSYGNELEYVYIRNGKYGMDFSLSDHTRSKMKMKNVVMTNFKGLLLNALNCNIEAENCEFSNAKDGLLSLTGGIYNFTHCTIANYYPGNVVGWGSSDNATVYLAGSYLDVESNAVHYYPVWQANFYNSIIWGEGKASDIAFDADEKAIVLPFFQNCLIPNKNAENDDPSDPNAQVVSCVIAKNPQFRQTHSDDLVYDFRLDSLSPARNVADPVIARKIPYDINGIDRFLDAGPDMGGYEFHSEK